MNRRAAIAAHSRSCGGSVTKSNIPDGPLFQSRTPKLELTTNPSMKTSEVLLANMPQKHLKALHGEAIRSGDQDAAASVSKFMVDRPPPSGCLLCNGDGDYRRHPAADRAGECQQQEGGIRLSRRSLTPTKRQFENLFVKSCWIYHVWDTTNKRALKCKEWAQRHLDAQWCVRASHQIRDLDLRRQWLSARYDGTSLPRLISAVRRHIEEEFEWSYPEGVSDTVIDTS